MSIRTIILLFIAGGAGASLRFLLTRAIQSPGGNFPWGTVAVNLLGCFLFGFLIVALPLRFGWRTDSPAMIVILSGFLGALTTFSAFSWDFHQLLAGEQYIKAIGCLAIQNLGGLLLLVAGMAIGRCCH